MFESQRRIRALTPAESAWVALIPCAILMLGAIAVLGPPLGHALFKRGSDYLWPPGWWETQGHPEPAKHGRYLLAVAAPVVLAVASLALWSLRPQLRRWTVRGLALAGQVSVLAVVVVAMRSQTGIFSHRDLLTAAALALAAAIACRWRRAVTWVAGLARERRLTRVASLGAAAAFAAIWAIEMVQSDGLTEDLGAMNWIPNGTYAVLDGRTPLVDVHIIYAKLLPYPIALAMAALGATTLVFTALLAVLTVAALLAVYAVYRRIVGSAFALGLFLPFVALSDTFNQMTLGSIWPMRYGGAYLLAWLTARNIDGRRPRRPWVLFFVAGLVTIDMLDVGLAALLGSIAALLCARPPGSARDVWRLARAVAVGLLGAASALTIFTLLRAGEPPSLGILLEWSRVFTGLGWFSLPVRLTSLSLGLYATFAGAIVLAATRAARREHDSLLTGMLAWSGVYGLMAGNYYVVRPDIIKLVSMFSAWGFALGLLTIACVRALTARRWRFPTLAELLVLFGFALAVGTIGRVHSPTQTIRALQHAPRPTYRPLAKRLVAAHTHRGEKVAILLPEGYRIAYELGLDNVSPYEMQNAVVTHRQIVTLIDAIRREGVKTLVTPAPGTHLVGDAEAAAAQLQLFRKAGFEPIATVHKMIVWRKAG